MEEGRKSTTKIETLLFTFFFFFLTQCAFDRMLTILFFLPFQLGFTLGNVVGMYLAQNYDVSILATSELNLIWIENIRMFYFNQNWIHLNFVVLLDLNRIQIDIQIEYKLDKSRIQIQKLQTLITDKLRFRWNHKELDSFWISLVCEKVMCRALTNTGDPEHRYCNQTST